MLDSWTIVSTLMRIQSAFEQAGVGFGLLRLNRECSATLDRPDFDGSAGAPGGLILILRPRRPIPPLAAFERIFWLRFANRTPAISCFREASPIGSKLQDEVKARLKRRAHGRSMEAHAKAWRCTTGIKIPPEGRFRQTLL